MAVGPGGAPPPCTIKVLLPIEPVASVSAAPKPFHELPFQPSPQESVIESVHIEPVAKLTVPEYGAPPVSVVPSSHERLHATSPGYEPPPTVTTDDVVGGAAENVAEPLEPVASVTLAPKPDHELPFQPSPQESVIVSVHVEPVVKLTVPENGAPPVAMTAPPQERLHATSPG